MPKKVTKGTKASKAANTLDPGSVSKWSNLLSDDDRVRVAQGAVATSDFVSSTTASRNNLSRVFNKNVGVQPELADQKSSGRCWIFATLNVARTLMIKKFNLPKSFQLSHSYVQFFHRLEQCNSTLENAWDMVCNSNVRSDSPLVPLFQGYSITDGGTWTIAHAIIQKYGLVPENVYPSNYQANSTHYLADLIKNIVTTACGKVWKMKSGDRQAFEKTKQDALIQVHRVLTIMLGPPPSTFDWSYYDNKKRPHEVRGLDPLRFYHQYVQKAWNPDKFIVLKSDDRRPFNQWHTLQYGKTVLGAPHKRSLNVPLDLLKQCVAKSITHHQTPVYFATDVSMANSTRLGIMDAAVRTVDELLGISASASATSRAEAFNARTIVANHAMVLNAVHMVDGKAVRWRVMNSWDRVPTFVMSDAWFDAHMMIAAVPASVVPKGSMPADTTQEDVIPFWDVFGDAQ